MGEPQDTYAELQKLWDTYCSIEAEHGVDFPQNLAEWTRKTRDSLTESSADISFDELCNQGCHAIPLAAGVGHVGQIQDATAIAEAAVS
jgi:hypothetical protein